MKLDLSEIIRTQGAHGVHEIGLSLREVEGYRALSPICGSLTADCAGEVLLLRGRVAAELELECARCGAPYGERVDAELQADVEIRPPQSPREGHRVVEDEEAPEARLFIAGTMDLDLDEFVRQSLLLALPLQPLCSEDCAGLCMQCGAAAGSCNCGDDEVDPRLRALAEILKRKGSADEGRSGAPARKRGE